MGTDFVIKVYLINTFFRFNSFIKTQFILMLILLISYSGLKFLFLNGSHMIYVSTQSELF